jgi:HAD superfamily hydrolase (TIGR01662 family)
MTIKAVFFDVGETLHDETRQWSILAKDAGVGPLVFFAALGAVIERRADHHEVWDLVGVERRLPWPALTESDLYPDALPCLQRLKAAGYAVGIAANQPDDTERALREMGVDLDVIASSTRWGVQKPAPEFFQRIVAEAGLPKDEIAYVGDRLDNDVLPAKRAGMFAVFIRRGPWGYIHDTWPEAAQADARIESLDELDEVLKNA